MYECLDIYFILCYNPIFSFSKLLSGTTWCSRFILYFPCPSLRLNHFFKDPWFLFLENLREDLGSHVLTVTRVSLLFVPLRTELGHTHSRIYISFYMSAHMLKIGIPPTPKKTRFILAYSFICNCLPNSKESRFYYV